MFSKSSFVLLVFALVGTNAVLSPFKLIDEYLEQFQNGLEELREQSLHHEFHQEDYHYGKDDEKKAFADTEEFDFIIVGAGASGSVLANRLSEESQWRILLLEAGGPETATTKVPVMHSYLQTTPYTWGYTTVPQNTSCLGMEHNKCAIGTGRALGGDSATNDMLYTLGHPKDYDTWADTGLVGWCWNSVCPYFRKIEDAYVAQPDRIRRYGGPVHIENFKYTTTLGMHFLKAAEEAGIKNIDYNGKERLGFGNPQVITKGGIRNSIAAAYLEPALLRKNLVVKPLSQVTKIIISPHTKEVGGVQYLHDGHLYVAKAAKEVILAAGAVNTPKLLLLSGIGPKEELQALKIPVMADLSVGYNLKDHTSFIGLNFIYNTTAIHHDIKYHDQQICEDELTSYLKHGEGPLTTTGLELVGFLKTAASHDKTDYPDVQFLIKNNVYNSEYELYLKSLRIRKDVYDAVWKPLKGKKGFTVEIVLLHPKSKGVLKLHDHDPLHAPLVNPNSLSDEDEEDVDTILAGIYKALKLVHSEPLQKLGVVLNHHKVPECEHEKTNDNYWRCAIRHLSVSLKHISGTARMGPDTDHEAVVDKELRVNGIHKLRVADASVIPVSISGNLMGPEIMIGEQVVAFVKKEWQKKDCQI